MFSLCSPRWKPRQPVRTTLASILLLFFMSPALSALVICGDCDRNGQVGSILDALAAARMIVHLTPTDPAIVCACDGDFTGTLNSIDVLLLAQVAAGYRAPIDCPGGCGLPAPLAGELWITEIMPDPAAVADFLGEWFEVTNMTTHPLDIAGLSYEAGGDVEQLPATFPIPLGAGRTYVMGASGDRLVNGGFRADHVWGGRFGLGNLGETLTLRAGSLVIFTITYDRTFPYAAGTAMSLDPATTMVTDTSIPGSWCRATWAYGAGDLGTPGSPNPSCP